MKTVDCLKALGVVMCVTVACNVYPQASYTGANGNMGASMSAAASKKAMKRADVKLSRTVLKAISNALPGVDATTIDVLSRGGAVTLTGSVPDQSQIDTAGKAAQSVPGVKSVSNKLTVISRSDSAG